MSNEPTLDNKKFILTNAKAISMAAALCVGTFWVTRFYFKTEQGAEKREYIDKRHDRKLKNERDRNEFILKIHTLEQELKICKNK